MQEDLVCLEVQEIEQVSGGGLWVAGVAAVAVFAVVALDNKYNFGAADAWYKLNS